MSRRSTCRRAIILLAGVLAGGGVASAARACIIVEVAPRMTFREARAVYEGRAVGDWHFKVERTWRGPKATRVEAPFVYEEATMRFDCTRQRPVEIGERYLLMVNCDEAARPDRRTLLFDCEAWAKPLAEAGEELAFLRGAPLLTPGGLAEVRSARVA